MADKTLTGLTAGPAFAATDFLYGKVGANSRKITGTVLAAFLATATLAAGTLTTSQPMTLTQTWNAAGVVFTGSLVNITPTAFAAGSLLADYQVSGVSLARFKLVGGGTTYSQLEIVRNTSSPTQYLSLNFEGGTASFNSINVNAAYEWRIQGNRYLWFYPVPGSSEFTFGKDVAFGWASAATVGTADLVLLRDAANTLAQRNGTAAQTLRLYGSWTDASNYERLELDAASGGLGVGGFGITANRAGSSTAASLYVGAYNDVYFRTGSSLTARWRISDAGHFLAVTDNTYDIGGVSTTRPSNVYAGTSMRAPDFIIGNSLYFGSGGAPRTLITGATDGILKISNNGQTDFSRLQFGGTTSSFPSLKRSAAELHARLADDSADANLQALAFKVATVQVVGAQGAAVADATDATSAITQLNALLARTRTHGLIAA